MEWLKNLSQSIDYIENNLEGDISYEEADQLSDTICIMKEGKELAQGTRSSLRSYTRQNMLRIGFSSTEEIKRYKDALDNTALIKFVNMGNNSVFIGVDDSKAAFIAMNKWLLDYNVDFNAIEIVEPSLEDVFLALTGSEEDREVE